MEADKDMGTPIIVKRTYWASGGLEIHLSVEAHKMNFYQAFQYYWCMFWECISGFATVGPSGLIGLFYWVFGMRQFTMPIWSGNLDTYVGLYGFLRLRIDPDPGGDFVPEINGCALIREVHVYGQSLGVGETGVSGQHRGYGKMLVTAAETLAAEHGFRQVAVIAGVGTREYYKNKCGYILDKHYMKKRVIPNL
jgi:histone acetyltransferase (RNA polymerase elongator complex component)